MAQITQVKLVDDLGGGGAAESVAFSLDGKEITVAASFADAARQATKEAG